MVGWYVGERGFHAFYKACRCFWSGIRTPIDIQPARHVPMPTWLMSRCDRMRRRTANHARGCAAWRAGPVSAAVKARWCCFWFRVGYVGREGGRDTVGRIYVTLDSTT